MTPTANGMSDESMADDETSHRGASAAPGAIGVAVAIAIGGPVGAAASLAIGIVGLSGTRASSGCSMIKVGSRLGAAGIR